MASYNSFEKSPYRTMLLNEKETVLKEYTSGFAKSTTLSDEASREILTKMSKGVSIITPKIKSEYERLGLGSLVKDFKVVSAEELPLEKISNKKQREQFEKMKSATPDEKVVEAKAEVIQEKIESSTLPSQIVNENVELEESILILDKLTVEKQMEKPVSEESIITENKGLPERVDDPKEVIREIEAEIKSTDRKKMEQEAIKRAMEPNAINFPQRPKKGSIVVLDPEDSMPIKPSTIDPIFKIDSGDSSNEFGEFVSAQQTIPQALQAQQDPLDNTNTTDQIQNINSQVNNSTETVSDFAVENVEPEHKPKYHKYSIKIFLGSPPEYDPDLEDSIYNSGLSKQEIIKNIDSIISENGKDLFIYSRKSDTLDELHECTQLLFCKLRNLQRGPRSKQALVPVSSLVNLYSKVNSQLSKTDSDNLPIGVPPPNTEIKEPPKELAEGSGSQVKISKNDAFEAVVEAHRNRPFDDFGKPIINEDIVEMARSKRSFGFKGPNTSKDLANLFVPNAPFQLKTKRHMC